jgi:acyl-coenzyme A thioesterase PaaI-like protein
MPSDKAQKIRQKYHDNCIVCGKKNPYGLHLKFQELGEEISSVFRPLPHMEGYNGLVHGGVLATLIDGSMANYLFAKGFAGLTSSLKVDYLKAANLSDTLKIVTGAMEIDKHKASLYSKILRFDEILVEAHASFFLMSGKV